MNMIQTDHIALSELKVMAEKMFGNMVKADVDILQKLIVFDAELHADIEQFLLDHGSRQEDLWGIGSLTVE